LTLVELLVVVAIITLMSAITLPTLRTVMTQRKSSQASILVKNALEAARTRAIAQGRPVAVVLERYSSRAERNPNFDAAQPITATNFPLQSVTASNTDYLSNYDIYNTCSRLSFAETPAPILFENIQFTLVGNVLSLPGAAADSRFAHCVRPGSTIEFPFIAATRRQLFVLGVSISGTDAMVTIDNPPNAAAFPTFLTSMIVGRQPIHYAALPSMTTLSAPTRMSVQMLPQPIASQFVDLPKGTCIDLSLSGFASSVRWITENETNQRIVNLRDARRHFASDWVATQTDQFPMYLRPVYIVFGPSGVLESVIMNGILDPSTGLPTVDGKESTNRYAAHDDVYLLVGRTDQIIRVDSAVTATGLAASQGGSTVPAIFPADLEAQNIKANINDSSAQWVRVSPNSGAISVATVASAYDSPLQSGVMPNAVTFPTIGEVLARSRSLSFTDEATAQ
jgi:Tfp pilus assembly protein FimT